MAGTTHAVVIGASMAGMLAAECLSRHVDTVSIIERDTLPDGAKARRGVPQALHAHLLWSSGARIIESILPGVCADLIARGARQLGVQSDLVSMSAYGWQYRFPPSQFMIVCSRPLLDSVITRRVLLNPSVCVYPDTEMTGLLGDAHRVIGINTRHRRSGTVERFDADLVVDASGRGSRLPAHLTALGLPPVAQDVIDSGLVYASRHYQALPASELPLVCVYSDHRTGLPGRNGVVIPIEGDQWLVTLSGTRGAEPSNRNDDFLPYARTLRHPLIADLIVGATALGPVRGSRSTANRRVHFEWCSEWPRGLAAVGDAVAALNPVYGHGMTAAARSVLALDTVLDRYDLSDDVFRSVQHDIARTVDDPWILAVSQDLHYPGCRTDIVDPQLAAAGARNEFVDLVGVAALRNPVVSAAYTEVASLSTPITHLQSDEVVKALRLNDLRPELQEPPLSAEECHTAGLRAKVS